MGELELGAAAEATVKAYKELAYDPTQTLILAQDTTCTQFLAYVVAEGTGSLLQTAVDTLDLLTTNAACKPILANTFGILEALQELADDARYCEDLRNQAAGIFTSLQFSRLNKEKSLEIDSKEKVENEDDKCERNNTMQPPSKVKWRKSRKESKKKKDNKFLGPHNTKAKTVTLLIKGMCSQGHRKKVETELVRVKGLISIVFDLTKSTVTCRLKKDLSIEKLVAAVEHIEDFESQQIIVTDGEDKIIDIGNVDANKSMVIDDPLPDYLPEDDSPIRNKDSAVASTGVLRDAASTFISAAANLLQSSFYW